jgi:hypothetical protein
VGTEDVTVEAPFHDSAAISARVRLENADPDLLPKVTFFAHADGDYQTYARTVASDGTLTMAGMASGRYKFMLAVSGLYVKSMTSANGQVRDGIVDVPDADTVAIDVVLGGDGGRITGKLRSKGKPVAPARVVLAPRTPSRNSVDYRSYQTESDGSFSYSAVKPGEYILFATTDWKLEFGNPDAVRELISSGQHVRVEAKMSTDVQLELPSFQ